MVMLPVASSNIDSVGYENRILHIRFRSGDLYEYYGVPQSVYLGLLSASSVGQYFHSQVKGRYEYRQIG